MALPVSCPGSYAAVEPSKLYRVLVIHMTSEERHELRYQRRRKKRELRKAERLKELNDFDRVFSYENLYAAYRECRKGCSWKASVQRFITQAPLLINKIYNELHDGTYRSGAMTEFTIRERGRERKILASSMSDMIVQRCLTDNALIPAFYPGFIHDNSASQPGKGTRFAIDRMCGHIRRHIRKYGKEGYILLFDFSRFFDNLSHKVIRWETGKRFKDRRLIGLTMHFVNLYGDVGMGVGSPISQVFALKVPDRLDHYIKEVLHIKGYGRYMDDGYLIHRSKSYLQKCLKAIEGICRVYGIKLNAKKTRIVKLSSGFRYLKNRIRITLSGKIIRMIDRANVTRMRRKLKKMKKLLGRRRLKYKDVYECWQSWRQYAKGFSSWRTVQRMSRLYNELFINPWLSRGR